MLGLPRTPYYTRAKKTLGQFRHARQRFESCPSVRPPVRPAKLNQPPPYCTVLTARTPTASPPPRAGRWRWVPCGLRVAGSRYVRQQNWRRRRPRIAIALAWLDKGGTGFCAAIMLLSPCGLFSLVRRAARALGACPPARSLAPRPGWVRAGEGAVARACLLPLLAWACVRARLLPPLFQTQAVLGLLWGRAGRVCTVPT
ncbi:uncharacterized protein K452DRAFT_54888 [Aplosporella prunicola CBS 121167]|uniref:Uncharacterized protein n=1 Tax=Aplosporella prunicola CBS 121167 TaxID=1176127 RepID=A0A6A6BAI7_9PEZI|nr:uncharacterized protein K452DRAFT_54888 [Aplosporella prunicola CBS 121167]KAF2140373.1 hypothetical protein K452DRAFT_54888 [Aplosporella prunicola CBS 121167]